MDATPQHGTAPFSNVPISAGSDEPAPIEVAGVADAWSNIEPPAQDEPSDSEPRASAPGLDEAPEAEPSEPDLAASQDVDQALTLAARNDQTPEPAESLPPAEESEPEPEERGGWTVALLGAGIAIIAACLLLPLAEENHQLAWQREKLKVDLEQIKQQVAVNGEFLHKVSDDPTLAERLAQRQMKYIRQGTSILDLHEGNDSTQQASPFQLVMLPPPNPIPPYQPLGGGLCAIVRNSRARLYLIGLGLLLLACGLVLGGGAKQTYDDPA
jgi:hypothetical protein